MISAVDAAALYNIPLLKNTLPFQKMLAETPLQLIRLRDFSVASAYLPHRHAFYMLLWTTDGYGQHRINYRDYDLCPGRVYFTHEGQVHQMLQYPGDGWILIFEAALFRDYIAHHPDELDLGLFDFFSRTPYVELNERVSGVFRAVIGLIAGELKSNPFSKCLPDSLSVLLCQANRLYQDGRAGVEDPVHAAKLRKLNRLINEHFNVHREISFYSKQLGLPARKLNELAKRNTGKLVNELVKDRLLSECEYLLGATALPMKEIIFDLGFADHAHFAYFIRKEKGMSPTSLRKQLHALHKNGTS